MAFLLVVDHQEGTPTGRLTQVTLPAHRLPSYQKPSWISLNVNDQDESTYDDHEGTIHAQTIKQALDIGAGNSGYTDAVEYLLTPNPLSEGEGWDAWVIRFWKPWIVERYRSFWDLMQAEYQVFKQINHE